MYHKLAYQLKVFLFGLSHLHFKTDVTLRHHRQLVEILDKLIIQIEDGSEVFIKCVVAPKYFLSDGEVVLLVVLEVSQANAELIRGFGRHVEEDIVFAFGEGRGVGAGAGAVLIHLWYGIK
jgi:hypothetical protein